MEILLLVISVVLFVVTQRILSSKYNGKFRFYPLIFSIIITIVGGIGYLATLFTDNMIYFVPLAFSGVVGFITCTLMLIYYKIKKAKF